MSPQDAYSAGFQARKSGKPHNPRNSPEWKAGYAWAHVWIKDDMDNTSREDDWMIDPEMEAKG